MTKYAILLGVALLSLAGVLQGDQARETEKKFLERLNYQMRSFTLTEDQFGRAVFPAAAFSFRVTVAGTPPYDIDATAESFFSRHEDRGLGPSVIYFNSGPLGVPQIWRVEFSGCEPGHCVSQYGLSPDRQATEDEFQLYYDWSLSAPITTKKIYEDVIDSIGFAAYVRAIESPDGGILRYNIFAYRTAKTFKERLKLWFAEERRDTPNIPFFIYSKNMVLNRAGQTFEPGNYSSSIDPLAGY